MYIIAHDSMETRRPRPSAIPSRLGPTPAGVGARVWMWAATAAFGLVVSLLKLGQHFSFQTQAYDLGVYANVLWNTAQGRFFQNTISDVSYLGDHFAPGLLLLAPLLWLWRDAGALLVFQSLALAAAVPAVYLLTERVTGRPRAALAFMVWFCLFPYLHRVSRFDFHEVALAIPLVLWALFFWEERRPAGFWACVAATCLLREDYALYWAGFGIYAFLSGGRRAGAALTVLGAALFAWEVGVAIPRFGAWRPAEANYANLGATAPQVLATLLHPVSLWKNSLGDPEKRGALLALLGFSGGMALAAPRQLLAVAAPLAACLLSGRPWQARLELHYSATVIPFLFYAMVHGYKNLSELFPLPGRALAAAFAVLLGVNAFHLQPYFRRMSSARRQAARDMLHAIPKGDSVQASNNLVPHLALRRDVWIAPDPRPSLWVLLDLSPEGFRPPPDQLRALEDFARFNRGSLVADREGFLLFRKTQTTE